MPVFLGNLIWIIAALLILGVLLWALNQIPGIDPTIKAVVRVIVIVIVAIWLIYFLASLFSAGVFIPPIRR